MHWLFLLVCVWSLEESVTGYKRSAHYGGGPPRGPHVHVHHPYKRHFRDHYRAPPPFPPKSHFHSAPSTVSNHVHHSHGPSGHQQQAQAQPQTHAAAYSHLSSHAFPVSHNIPYPQSHPAPVPYPNPNFIQQHNAYQAPGVQTVVAQPLPTPTPTPTYLPAPTPYIPPAATYIPAYLRDDDKGPIHTIPAPNLSPADRPANFDEFMQKNSVRSQANLITNFYRKPYHHYYQVQEDSGSSKGALFAPDPDPSVPTLKVPPTTDPHSIPSNGQVPLDLYLQQESEKQQLLQEQALQQQAYQQQALQQQAIQQQVLQSQQGEQEENGLTAQDLYNLLNYQPNLIPESQLQQHILQPNVQFYSNPLYLQHSQFMNPQYHNFNYDQTSHRSVYGTESFPLQSLSSYFGNPEESADLSDPIDTNEIAKKVDQRDTKRTSEKYHALEKASYTSLSSKEVAEALASLSAAGALNNGEQFLNDENNDRDEIMKQEENKAIAYYESSFPSVSAHGEAQGRRIESDVDATSNYNLIKSEKLTDLDVNLENHVQNGNRMRPKRY